MECKNCELRQRHFYCASCLKTHLRDFCLKTQHVSGDRDEHVVRAARALKPVEEQRRRRADLAVSQAHVQDLRTAIAARREENEKARAAIKSQRAVLANRRRTLATARALPPAGARTAALLQTEPRSLAALSDALARARAGLVQELVEVFHVVEVGGRPPIGGRAGSRGEWTIGDLVLPVPGDIRRYPPDHINAVLTHAVHFLGLLTFYLGVKLPFDVIWSGRKLGVGQPWIGATKGTESGSWARWTTRHPLHLSATPDPPPTSPGAGGSGAATSPLAQPPLSASTADSYADFSTAPPALARQSAPPPASFTTAFAMLLYDVCYLAHTQAVEVPLSQAGDALGNLWAVCCSPELGRRSHQTTTPVLTSLPPSLPPLMLTPTSASPPTSGPPGSFPTSTPPHARHHEAQQQQAQPPPVALASLPPPTPPAFPLDFAQLLQATSAHPSGAAARARRAKERAGSGAGSSSARDAAGRAVRKGRRESTLQEVEEGWDLVDDVGVEEFG